MIAGRYILQDRVGRGASGSVYRAHDRVDGREVAVKLLSPGLLAGREAHALARLDHPQVVGLHAFGEAEGLSFLVLELLDGVDLQTWLATDPPLADRLAAFLDAGQGLAAAHDAGLVHRDFKPSNVIRTYDARVVVIDFGLAGGHELEIDEFELPSSWGSANGGTTGGTLAYMAPEQLAGRNVDERSDQFSFCVALWQALADRAPFDWLDRAASSPGFLGDLRAHCRAIERGPDPRALADVPAPIVAGLTRGLAFDPNERHANMRALLRELDRGDRSDRSGEQPAQPRRSLLRGLVVALTGAIKWQFAPERPNPIPTPTPTPTLAVLDPGTLSAPTPAVGPRRPALGPPLR